MNKDLLLEAIDEMRFLKQKCYEIEDKLRLLLLTIKENEDEN